MNRKRSSRSHPDSFEPGFDHRLQQVCARAYEVLSLAIEGECGDPVLQQLSVRAVLPDPDGSRLAVHVSAPPGESAPAILEALERAKGLLRSQLASELNKKRTPNLRFVLYDEGEKP
jgi:ribosome-binding factor A